MRGVENESEGCDDWRRLVEMALRRDQRRRGRVNKTESPVSVPASLRTSVIKRIATTMLSYSGCNRLIRTLAKNYPKN